MIDADLREGSDPIRPTRGRDHDQPPVLGEDCRGHADRRGAAANQERLAGLGIESDAQRPMGGLKHLGHRADHRPVQFRGERNDLCRRHARVLRVAAIEGATHPSHESRNLLARLEIAAGRSHDDADGLDAEYPRERHALSKAETGMQLGAVEPERLHLDQHPAVPRRGNRQVANPQRLRRTRGIEDDCAHRAPHGSPPPVASRKRRTKPPTVTRKAFARSPLPGDAAR